MHTTSRYLGITILVLFAATRDCLGRSLLGPVAESEESGDGRDGPNSSYKAGVANAGRGYSAAWSQQNGRGAGADHFRFNFPRGNGRAGQAYGDNNNSPTDDGSYSYSWGEEHGFPNHGEWTFRGHGGSYGAGEYMGGAGGGNIPSGSGDNQGSSFSWAGSSAMGNGEGHGYGYGYGGDTREASSSHSGGAGGSGGYAP